MEENGNANYDKVRQPQLSSIVNLSQPEKLHGLTERIVAVESLIFRTTIRRLKTLFRASHCQQSSERIFTSVLHANDSVCRRLEQTSLYGGNIASV